MRIPLILVVAAVSIVVVSCDDDGAGDAERFCTNVAENVDELRAVPVTEEQVDELIELWRDIGDDAPLAVEDEWDTHAGNLDLAWTSDDPQEVVASAFAAERSAVAIAEWLDENCGIDWGPVTTIVPASLPEASVPGSSSSTTSSTAPSG